MSSALGNFLRFVATLILGGGLTIYAASAADKPQTFTGKVSDSICGAHHMMEGSAADCTRACVKKGSKYALVVGDKVYTLDTPDQATLDKLDQLADKTAKVQGTPNGDTIQVTSVSAGK
jgi:hypothetical protein